MSTHDEVMKIGKKLEKMISNDTADQADALDMLKVLKKLPMTLEVLQKTRIGMTVNNFRKSNSKEEVISLAKSLIKSWKKLLPESQANSSLNRSNSVASTSSKDGENSRGSEDSQPDDPEPMSPKDKKKETPVKQTSFPAKASDTTDSVRLKCREMLSSALKLKEHIDGAADPDDIAAQLEECIFDEFKNTESKYKNRVRSRIANLKDVKNPQLRENVLLGVITPGQFAKMSAEEMASDDLKNKRAKFTKQAIEEHQMAVTSGTTTDLLKCGKCGKRNCTYNQVQTRSADEPMTTFVLCNSCGHRWKFC